jgi:hypothetical protein
MDSTGDHWRLTTASAHRLFTERFVGGHTKVRAYGNVLTAIAFLEGMACEELTVEELDVPDPTYQLIVAVRALKAA